MYVPKRIQRYDPRYTSLSVDRNRIRMRGSVGLEFVADFTKHHGNLFCCSAVTAAATRLCQNCRQGRERILARLYLTLPFHGQNQVAKGHGFLETSECNLRNQITALTENLGSRSDVNIGQSAGNAKQIISRWFNNVAITDLIKQNLLLR